MFYEGPCLNLELYKLLLQFPSYPVVITADIKKAYLQISSEEEDRYYLRLLWFSCLFDNEAVKICKYGFTSVIFELACSQFLLNITVNKHIQRYCGIDAVKRIKSKFYAYDLKTGITNVDEGIDLRKKLRTSFGEGHFNLRKCCTNNEQLRHVFGECLDKNYGGELSIKWDEFNDNFIFHLSDTFEDDTNVRATKRSILIIISSVYDPVGCSITNEFYFEKSVN